MTDDDRLDAFASETPGPAGPVGSRVISLDQIVARAVPVHWDEAVAVIEELCGLLMSPEGRELPVPGLGDVLIAADGAVALQHPGRGVKGPVEAGRALHLLLSTADVPVALRLFVTQATAPETYASLREFASGLAYFGKPGRPELIRALYDRSSRAAGVVGPTVTKPRAPEAPVVKRADTEPLKRKRPTRAITVGIAVCLLAAVVWIWSNLVPIGVGAGDATNLLTQAKQALADLGADVSGAAGADKAPGAGAEQPASPAGRKPGLRTTSASNRPAANLVNRASSEAAATLGLWTPPAMPAMPAVAIPPPVEAPSLSIEPAIEPKAAPVLYSTADTDVLPPVLLYPQLPAPLMLVQSGTVPVNRMELVVSADGIVEHVRLVDGPTRMPDMMLLSGAKMWKFTPAFKDGEPVRYRAIVTWSGFP